MQADAVDAVKCGALAANARPAVCEDCTIQRGCELCVPTYALAATVDRQLSTAPRVFALLSGAAVSEATVMVSHAWRRAGVADAWIAGRMMLVVV